MPDAKELSQLIEDAYSDQELREFWPVLKMIQSDLNSDTTANIPDVLETFFDCQYRYNVRKLAEGAYVNASIHSPKMYEYEK